MDEIIVGDCAEVLKTFAEGSIDLTVTSPPYDNLRNYNGYSFDFETIAKELFRVTKDGGVVVWVVGDATVNGSETGTSFRQALYFKECGFNLHDTMIFHKFPAPRNGNRYEQHFEYMFVFSKGKPKAFNPIKEVKKQNIKKSGVGQRDINGILKPIHSINYDTNKVAGNVWFFPVGGGDKIASQHPAIFPEKLAGDHILSWSNPGDVVLDPFSGSGTTLKMAKMYSRHYIGIEISEEYAELARKRLLATNVPLL